MVTRVGGVLWVLLPGLQGGDTEVTAVSHHLQCGGGCSGIVLGQDDGRERGKTGRARTVDQTHKCPLLS